MRMPPAACAAPPEPPPATATPYKCHPLPTRTAAAAGPFVVIDRRYHRACYLPPRRIATPNRRCWCAILRMAFAYTASPHRDGPAAYHLPPLPPTVLFLPPFYLPPATCWISAGSPSFLRRATVVDVHFLPTCETTTACAACGVFVILR